MAPKKLATKPLQEKDLAHLYLQILFLLDTNFTVRSNNIILSFYLETKKGLVVFLDRRRKD